MRDSSVIYHLWTKTTTDIKQPKSNRNPNKTVSRANKKPNVALLINNLFPSSFFMKLVKQMQRIVLYATNIIKLSPAFHTVVCYAAVANVTDDSSSFLLTFNGRRFRHNFLREAPSNFFKL